MRAPTRVRIPACIHPETYKYFVAADAADEVWRVLEARFGSIRRIPAFDVIEIQSERFLLRATTKGSPITVIRTRACRPEDVDELHALIGFAT